MIDPASFNFNPSQELGSKYHDKVSKRPENNGNIPAKPDSFESGQTFQNSEAIYKKSDSYYRKDANPAEQVSENSNQQTTVKGYDENFLGFMVPLPKPTGKSAEQVLVFGKNGETIRKYTHHSIIMNRERKMCMLTANNIDGPTLREDVNRSKWDIDPVIGAGNQLDEKVYSNNILDKGHMVRRRDVVWGDKETASKANNETFLYPNAVPQHAKLNQEKWNDLENWLLQRADRDKQRLSVFTAPIFSDSDMSYRGEKIPSKFFKVVVLKREVDHQVAATAFIMSQEELLSNLDKQKQPENGKRESDANIPTETVAPYQVTIEQVEKMTGIDFGDLKDVDPYALFQEKQKTELAKGTGTSPYSAYLADSFTTADFPDLFPHYINTANDIII